MEKVNAFQPEGFYKHRMLRFVFVDSYGLGAFLPSSYGG
jgi:hypothetical protein